VHDDVHELMVNNIVELNRFAEGLRALLLLF